jgi:hypothetical protein
MDQPSRPTRAATGWLSATGLDFHVLLTLVFRGWSVLAGATTVMLVPIWLSPIEQGYYYTFATILGLQIFFELGLSQVVVQIVGHEAAHLHIGDDRGLVGDAARIGRLSSLARLLHRWYAVAALLFALVGGLAGAAFLGHRTQLPTQQWLGVWAVLVLCTAANLVFVPAVALMEGFGQVGQVARMRLIQSVAGYTVVWLVLMAGGKLWAATMLPLTSVVVAALWLRGEGGLHAWLRRQAVTPQHRIDWRREVLPFQWRIALSWIAGFFIFYALTPIAFQFLGAAEAGRLGMALTIFTAVSTIGMSWVNAKAPTFAMHISRGERAELNAVFMAVTKRSTAFTFVGALAVVTVVALLNELKLAAVQRIAGLPVLICLAAIAVANSVVFSAAAYMRAHREEPMLPVSMTAGAVTLLAALVGAQHSIDAMALLYAMVTLLLSLPWSLRLFLGYYRRIA